ncbi:MAG: AMIN domain-containing protein [Porticoccaceae bacterium]|nr:AMIN domain-containing protein [Porticoccaceae bacterium]MDG1485159.1 N-acetylmuramoyl-L-alanine amidase [Porticoccaceae bacterium]
MPIQLWAADIESVRLWRAPDKTRLVLDLSSTVEHNIFSLQNPNRLVVDLSDSRIKTTFEGLELRNTPIAGIRAAVRNKTDVRVVLDLSGTVSPKSFTLPANEQYSNRLVIDLFDNKRVISRTLDEVVKKKDRRIIVAIDAGHGGEDPGALGPRRVREKVVVLQLAKKIKKLFDGNPNFQGELVRSGDYYLAHRKRTQIARDKQADFFISIHADAFTDPSAHGASVYALSTTGATSEQARYLADKENRADLIGGASSLSLDGRDEVLAGVLLDLSMNATLRRSLDAGSYVLKNMGTVARLHKKKVEQAGFLVLKSPDIPSLLLETGFISNPNEAQKLSTSGYQNKMAQAIFEGIEQYFLDNPPPGTLLAKNGNRVDRIYVVAPGDTLSEIAVRFNVSMKKIKRYNKMSSNKIRVGKKIKIPPR